MKVWSGFTKFIRSQGLQGKAVDTGIFGIFYMDSGNKNSTVSSEISAKLDNFYYQPTLKFLDETEMSLHENEYNINPYNEISQRIIRMNITGIASVCNCKSDTVNHVLCELSKKLYSLLTDTENYNKLIVLNLRIGFLKI